MKPIDFRLKILKNILFQAFHEKDKPEVGDAFRLQVMTQVRKLGPLSSRLDFPILFERFVWRLAPVTGLLIIAGLAILLKFDFTPDYNVFLSFVTDTGEIGLSQLLPI